MSEDIFAEARGIAAQMEERGGTFKGGINVYACTPSLIGAKGNACGHWIVTVDRDVGVTPMFLKCGHCDGNATSRMYKVGDGLDPTHEWFRPASEAEMPDGYTVEKCAQHLRNGGLLLRPLGDGRWLAPTPETRAFVEHEQRMLAALGTGRAARTAPVSRQQRRYEERTGRKAN